MKRTKFSKNRTRSNFSEKMIALQQEHILLLQYGVNPETILAQGNDESERQSESLFVEPDRKHVRKNLQKRKRSRHAIVSIEAVSDDNSSAGFRFVAINDTFKRMTGITGKQAQGKMVNDIWPDTEAYLGKAYIQMTESGSTSAFTLYHTRISKFYRCHLFNPDRSRKLFFVIFTDITNQQAKEVAVILEEKQQDHPILSTSPKGSTSIGQSV